MITTQNSLITAKAGPNSNFLHSHSHHLQICDLRRIILEFCEKMASDQQKKILELRKEFLKQSQNPYRHMTAEGGTVVSFRWLFRECWLDNFSAIVFSTMPRFIVSKRCACPTTITSSPRSSRSRPASSLSSHPSSSSQWHSNTSENRAKLSSRRAKSRTKIACSSSFKSTQVYVKLVIKRKL